ncbi:MAG: hypothetical protein AB7O24_25260 [Kofleriaceae bacterium]
MSLEPLLGLDPGLHAAAKADDSGNVKEVAGHLDERACTAVAMCSAPLERASALLGLGPLSHWTFVTNKKVSLYVHRTNDGFVMLTGGANKNPEQTLAKLGKALGKSNG